MACSGTMNSFGSNDSSSRRTSSASYPGPLKCYCGDNVVIRTVKKGDNNGKKFYGCPRWPNTECNFFRWMDVSHVQEVEELRYQLFEKNVAIAELEVKYDNLVDKVKKLDGKKGTLSEACQDMGSELWKKERNEKMLAKALFLSWVLIAFILFFK